MRRATNRLTRATIDATTRRSKAVSATRASIHESSKKGMGPYSNLLGGPAQAALRAWRTMSMTFLNVRCCWSRHGGQTRH